MRKVTRTSTAWKVLKPVINPCYYCGRDLRKFGRHEFGGKKVCGDCYEALVMEKANEGRS